MSSTKDKWGVDDVIAILWLLGVTITLILFWGLLLDGAFLVLPVLFPLIYVLLTKSTRQKQIKQCMSICARIFH